MLPLLLPPLHLVLPLPLLPPLLRGVSGASVCVCHATS